MQFVQLVLSDEQAQLVAMAIPLAMQNTSPDQWDADEERAAQMESELQRLDMFFTGVASEPSRFPVTGRMADRLKTAARKAKGPAQRVSRRKVRSQGQQKRDRAARREAVAAYNQARERVEQDMQEMEAAHAERVAQIEAMLAKRAFQHEELVELFTLLGSPELAAKAVELHTREENPQAILDAAAEAARLPTQPDPDLIDSVTGGVAMDLSDHPALD